MKRIGQVLHIGPGDRAIVKAEVLPKIGAAVFDGNKKLIGTVLDVFGPVYSPYAEVKTKCQDPKKIVNRILYILPKQRNVKRKRR